MPRKKTRDRLLEPADRKGAKLAKFSTFQRNRGKRK